MNTLEMMGLERKSWYLSGVLPIVFPVRTEKHEEFFRALEKEKTVRYSWKFGRVMVRGREPLKHEDFAEALGRIIPTATDLIRILSVSGVSCKIIGWENYLSFREVKDLEEMTGAARLCLPAPEGSAAKKETISITPEVRELAERKEKIKPIFFPVENGDEEISEFFRVLRVVRRVTYNYGKGVMYLIDTAEGNRTTVKTISHEDFAKAVGQNISTSAEMLLLLSLSRISFRVTEYEDMISEEKMTEINDFLSHLATADV